MLRITHKFTTEADTGFAKGTAQAYINTASAVADPDSGAYENTFANERFAHELAAAAGMDPIAFPLAYLDPIDKPEVLAGWRASPKVTKGAISCRGAGSVHQYEACGALSKSCERAARATAIPGMVGLLETTYQLFLAARPHLAWLFTILSLSARREEIRSDSQRVENKEVGQKRRDT